MTIVSDGIAFLDMSKTIVGDGIAIVDDRVVSMSKILTSIRDFITSVCDGIAFLGMSITVVGDDFVSTSESHIFCGFPW